ncbi:MAG: (2Fe-2S) ferredoxin domain-containing protein [Polyangiaceae bacterium]|nr:(2Fe-2S) ferredoxin domain-containing protein [Polyangiaceae bacterium]
MPLRQRYLFVCVNRRPDDAPKGSCAARGSEALHAALKSATAARGLARTVARPCTSSCLDVCTQGPVVLVEPDQVFLGRVTEADVPAIVDALAGGEWPAHLLLTRDEIDAG